MANLFRVFIHVYTVAVFPNTKPGFGKKAPGLESLVYSC